ncbi:hypothetical protein [Halorarum salinum]|uniref:Uncharacterized protein n=1 Tax=Halorarum salinum TaxID=2743089 RepID=A0A7D5LBS2_9EURY|nr:hypothetical protein [Halobaculum salinum]QLG62810.1 hypothetical protein HUG12_14175 [Halobaculum salinum]
MTGEDLPDDVGLAGKACGYTPTGADGPTPGVIRGSIREEDPETGVERARVLVDPEGKDVLVNTDRTRVEVF